MSRRIVCIGTRTDRDFAYTVRKLRHLAQLDAVVIDLEAFSERCHADLDLARGECHLKGEGGAVRVDASMVAFQRFIPLATTFDRQVPGRAVAERVVSLMLDSDFFSITVNRVNAGWENGCRPIHYRQLRAFGFSVPTYIITTDADCARRFCDEHGRVYVKSCNHHRTVARMMTSDHFRRLQDLRWAPALFQRAIDGPDVRVHVVDDECFAVQIDTQAEDYRYAGTQDVSYRPVAIPQWLAFRCVRATHALGLRFAGIDFKVCRASGDWFALEVNPMPGYSGFDRRLGGAISSALARFLDKCVGHTS